ncbi:hypothetical protein CHLRE_02g106300v5 [Chlamydomonas reinhardtii]|uniref:Uncharacterized protein n=1 Tax=Chlamydomonas reinhardtii TaxID=3055 RepID=A0A2K3E2N9_CHLRE|nr:uncharacterized protein CHLRE_02g106300v5 [Chlamydomonas reinhardtii]PNW87038.1 hypothetical protein CHLRE_02g106300v5 [Chlamydomonas reinhardtii]
MEIVAGVVVLLYVIVALLGTRGNDAIAQAFARQHCVSPDSIFPRQFAMCGAGDPGPNGVRSALVKESTNTYKFYASGRRHCQGLLATLVLKNRADLLGWLLGLFFPQEDLLEIEVYVSDMSPMVMAVATPRQAKALQDRRDVRAYTKPVKVQPQPGAAAGGDGVPSWNNAKLQVLAEHSSFFYDLFGEPRLHGIFTSAAHADKLRLFRSLLVSSENGGGQKQVLRFVFALPSADDMAALAPLLALVPLLTDLVAMYRVNPELKKKLAEARARTEEALAEAEEARKKRVEALQRKKIEKALEEKERLARLNPEARRKAEEKLAKQAAKKGMKVKMVRM